MPFLSIITSAYNAEKYIEKMIGSVLKQTFCDFEFIIVNNASTDRTGELISKYDDPRIKLINNDVNNLSAGARNQAINVAEGKYIVFADSDDYLEVSLFERIYKLLSIKDYDLVVYGWYMEYFIDNYTLSFPVVPEENSLNNISEIKANLAKYLANSILTVPWNKVYKTSIIKENKVLFQKVKLEDHHFNMDYLMFVSSIYFISEPYYHYFRLREGSDLVSVHTPKLFELKKSHYLHSKQLFEKLGIIDKSSLKLLYTFFGERIVECVQEIYKDSELTKKEKKIRVKEIFNDSDAKDAIKNTSPVSTTMKLMIIPFKIKSELLCRIECNFISWYQKKHLKKFIIKKSKVVNNSKNWK